MAAETQREKERKDERMNFLVLLVNLVGKVVARMDEHLLNINGTSVLGISTRPLQVFKERLEAIPMIQLPSGGAPVQLVFVITFIDHFIVSMDGWMRGVMGDNENNYRLSPERIASFRQSRSAIEVAEMRAATHVCLVTLVRLMLQIQHEADDVEKHIDPVLVTMNLPRRA